MSSFLALRRMALPSVFCLLSATALLSAAEAPALHRGYYTDPAVHGDTIVFTSEGDLWSIGLEGGQAHRLTASAGSESNAIFSPDGKTIAFAANYEGPHEVYTIPVEGGLPQRRTWDGDAEPEAFAPDGRLAVATARYATLPGTQLELLDDKGGHEVVPLAQAAEAAYSTDGHTLFFTRWFRQWSETKRYKGGWAENIWSFDGSHEAKPLTADFPGTSTRPMFANGRVYFLSDRDGVMNVFSMDADGHGVKQESHQHIFDVQVCIALRRAHRLRLRLRSVAARPCHRP